MRRSLLLAVFLTAGVAGAEDKAVMPKVVAVTPANQILMPAKTVTLGEMSMTGLYTGPYVAGVGVAPVPSAASGPFRFNLTASVSHLYSEVTHLDFICTVAASPSEYSAGHNVAQGTVSRSPHLGAWSGPVAVVAQLLPGQTSASGHFYSCSMKVANAQNLSFYPDKAHVQQAKWTWADPAKPLLFTYQGTIP